MGGNEQILDVVTVQVGHGQGPWRPGNGIVISSTQRAAGHVGHDQHTDVVGVLVGCEDIHPAVAVDVGAGKFDCIGVTRADACAGHVAKAAGTVTFIEAQIALGNDDNVQVAVLVVIELERIGGTVGAGEHHGRLERPVSDAFMKIERQVVVRKSDEIEVVVCIEVAQGQSAIVMARVGADARLQRPIAIAQVHAIVPVDGGD